MPDERSIAEVVAEVRNLSDTSADHHRCYACNTAFIATEQDDPAFVFCAMEPDERVMVDRRELTRLCDEIERLQRMLEALPGMIEQMQTYAGDDEVIVLTQSSYNQLREDAGWPVVWSSKKPKDVQAWREFMKGGE